MDCGVERVVRVHLAWNGWQCAEIPFDALTNVHWRQPGGAPHRLVHAYVDCRIATRCGLPHACDAVDPHRLLVCVLKHHATVSTYRELAHSAEARDRLSRAAAAG